MKKIITRIVFILLMITSIQIKTYALENVEISPSNLHIEIGKTKKIEISFYNTIGDISISSLDKNIASVNINSWQTGIIDEKQTINGEVIVKGLKKGKTKIKFKIDAATFDGKDLSNKIIEINVDVLEKENYEKNKNEYKNQKQQKDINSSKNTNLINDISIENYNLIKENDNNYLLTVGYEVKNININASSKEKETKIEGIGEKKLNVGENNFEITASLNNQKEIIQISVIRKNKKIINKKNSKKTIIVGISIVTLLLIITYIIKKIKKVKIK